LQFAWTCGKQEVRAVWLGGLDGLACRYSRLGSVWNRIEGKLREDVVGIALNHGT
jgi:hypothetical protein